MIFNTIVWNVNPTIVKFGSFIQIRWYGLLFATAFLTGFYLIKYMFKKDNLPIEWADKFLVYMVIGVIVGARLGHCLFYDPVYYLSNPIKIIKVWEGGLASHGGILGMIIGLYILSKKVINKPMLWLTDRLSVIGSCGAIFIRLGNLMNSEIIGKPTNLPWGFSFERALHLQPVVPRHPTQIYESLFYMVTFGVLSFLYFKTKQKENVGFISGILLIFLFTGRFLIEFIKENQSDFESSMVINMGQILSIPFILAGIYLVYTRTKKAKA